MHSEASHAVNWNVMQAKLWLVESWFGKLGKIMIIFQTCRNYLFWSQVTWGIVEILIMHNELKASAITAMHHENFDCFLTSRAWYLSRSSLLLTQMGLIDSIQERAPGLITWWEEVFTVFFTWPTQRHKMTIHLTRFSNHCFSLNF